MPPRRVQSQVYDIDNFDLTKRRPCRLTAIIAKRDSGKTMIQMYLAMNSEWRHRGIFMVISRTAKARALWSKIVHPGYVFPPDPNLLNYIRLIQEANIDKYEAEGRAFPPELHVSLYIDDCGALAEFMRSAEMKEAICNGRQWNTDITVTLQHLNSWPPEGRENADEVMIMANGSETVLKDIRKEYIACMAKKDADFINIVQALTKDFGVCVIKNKGGAVEDIVHWLRIPDELLVEKIDERGEPYKEFKELVPVGNPYLRTWANDRLFISSRTPEELAQDESPDFEEDKDVPPPKRPDRFGSNSFVRMLPKKIKND